MFDEIRLDEVTNYTFLLLKSVSLYLTREEMKTLLKEIKDPYIFDFLHMTEAYDERDLENALVSHVTQFLLELGAGFAYLGKQVLIQVGERDFYIDLLFYHTRLHCYIVTELKTVEFEPEHAGKLNFYLKAVDSQLRSEHDEPSIGILICKKKDKLVAEYALSDIHKPIGISEYQLTQSLPVELQSSLPSIEEIERELGSLDEWRPSRDRWNQYLNLFPLQVDVALAVQLIEQLGGGFAIGA